MSVASNFCARRLPLRRNLTKEAYYAIDGGQYLMVKENPDS